MARINKSSVSGGDTFYGSDHIYINPFNPGSSLTPGTGGDSWISNQPDVSAPVGPEIADTDSEMARMVKNSAPYKQAYALFSKETDKTWLMLLEAIPYSVTDAEEFWTDGWLTSGYSDKVSANYQYCMEQINKLIKDYMTYRNSLPTTQANQLAQIGYNSAITGDGLNGSEMSFTDPSTNPASVLHSSPLEGLKLFSDVVLSGIPGVLSTAVNTFTSLQNLGLSKESQRLSAEQLRNAIRNTDLSEDKFMSDLYNHYIDQGYDLKGKIWNNFDDFLSEIESIKADPVTRTKVSKNKISDLEQHLLSSSYAPILTRLLYYPDEEFNWNGMGASQFIDELSSLQLNQFMYTLKHNSNMSKYNSEYWSKLNGVSAAESQNALNDMNKRKAEFDKEFYNQRLSFYKNWIERSKNDPVSKMCLIQALFNDELITGSVTGLTFADALGEITSDTNTPYTSTIPLGL